MHLVLSYNEYYEKVKEKNVKNNYLQYYQNANKLGVGNEHFFFSSKTTICFLKKHSQMFSSEQSLNGNFTPGVLYP